MSDHVVQSCHVGDGKAEQSVHSYQSVWMAHWTRTSCNVAPCVHDRISLRLENNNNDRDSVKHHLLSGLEVASDSPSAKGFAEVTETRTVRIMNEGLTSSKKVINEKLDCQPFPMFRYCQNSGSGFDPKIDPDISLDGRASRPQIECNIGYNTRTTMSHFPPVLAGALPATETSSRECQSVGVSRSPEELVHSHKDVGGSSFALAGPSQDNFIGSTQMLPCRFNNGKTPLSSSFTSKQELNQLSSILASKDHLSNADFPTLGHEHNNYHGPSALLVGEKNLDNRSTTVKYGTSVVRQSSASQSPQDPFAGNCHLPILVGERCKKIQKCSVTGFFPSSSSSPEATISDTLYRGYCSPQKMPGSVHGMETLKICTANTVEGLAGGSVAFSQTTQNLLFMKKTDDDLTKENQTFRESKVSAKLKGNMFGEFLSLSPPLGQNQQKLKLQPFSTSTESEEKNNVEGVGTSEVRLRNESSAETDTMDMDAFKEQNYLSGVNSSPFNKDTLTGQNPPSLHATASAEEEVGRRCSIPTLPDINEEIPVVLAAGSSMDKAEPSTSRTQSLDAEHLLSHSEKLTKTNLTPYPDGPPSLDPGSRWLKRLKLSASDSFPLGTKSSNTGEESCHETVNKLFGKIQKGSKSSSSEPMSRKPHGEKDTARDQTAVVLRNGEESAKKGRDELLLHPWIQRWCRNRQAHQKKPKAVVVCEPQSTRLDFDDLRNKQFPSIAAMALMGKSMSGFQPCEYRKRGSFVVWNTKGF